MASNINYCKELLISDYFSVTRAIIQTSVMWKKSILFSPFWGQFLPSLHFVESFTALEQIPATLPELNSKITLGNTRQLDILT